MKFGHHFDGRVKNAPLAILCMYTYTMQDVDIDRFLLFLDVPPYPDGKESPAERDEHYRQYRNSLAEPRNPQMFQACNWATRTCWDSFAQGNLHQEALAVLNRYIKWQSCISALRQRFDPPLTTTRGLCGLPESIVKELSEKKESDLIFWAAMSSTTLNEEIAASYAQQQKPADRNVLFTIEGVRDGIKMYQISVYPAEEEVLLPMCTALRVQRVIPGSPLRLICRYEGTLLPTEFDKAVLDDLQHCSDSLKSTAAAHPMQRANYIKKTAFVTSQRHRLAMRREGLT